MKLSSLLRNLEGPAGPIPVDTRPDPDPEISGICPRSGAAFPGCLFVAVPGFAADGHDFADEAVRRGAVAVLAERPLDIDAPVVRVPSTRATLGPLAARFRGDPSRSLTLVGITGTNGKTTVALLVESIFAAAGHRAGMIGTIDRHYAGRSLPSPTTTPESDELQTLLAEMRDAGVTHVAMEVSSHAVDLHRIDGCAFDVGVFTNLTRDHLDHHGTMDAYWACKRRFFVEHLPRSPKGSVAAAVVNGDDPRGRALLAENPPIRCFAVGQSDTDMVRTLVFRADLSGMDGELLLAVSGPEGGPPGPAIRIPFRTRLIGAHNLENIRCAAGAGLALGLSPEIIRDGVAALSAVPGRLEPVPDRFGRFAFVDYAHTPDALEHALASLRPLTNGRLLCVFGCGGDRDRTKRPLMGEAAGRLADGVVLTSDNPRTESPEAILADILAGLERIGRPVRRIDDPGASDPNSDPDPDAVAALAGCSGKGAKGGIVVEPDRRRAIRLAVAAARPGDAVLIAGKGHETYQIVGRDRRPFDDRAEARAALDRFVPGGGGR